MLIKTLWKIINTKTYAHASTGSFIVVPKMSDDKPANNDLLCYDRLPSFGPIPSSRIFSAVHKACLVSEIYLDNILNRANDANSPAEYSSLVDDLELLGVPIAYTFNNAFLYHLLSLDPSMSSCFGKSYKHWIHLIKLVRQSQPLSRLMKSATECGKLSDGILQITSRQNQFYSRFAISDENKRQDLFLYTEELEKSIRKYCSKAQEIADNSTVNAEDPELLKKVPDLFWDFYFGDIPRAGVEVKADLVEHILQFVSNRAFRWNLWQSYLMIGVTRGGNYHESNAVTIGTIRHQCYRRACLLGFEHAAAMSVGSSAEVVAVDDLLSKIKDGLIPLAIRKLEEVQAFAEGCGFRYTMEEYDVIYWRRAYEERNSGVTYDVLAGLFLFEEVIEGLFDIFGDIFGVTFNERTDVGRWHENVRCYDIADGDGVLGSFYLDPFRNLKKQNSRHSFCHKVRGRSDLLGVTPACYISLNLCARDGKAAVPFEFLEDLCFQFSTMFHQIWTSKPYHGIVGLESPSVDNFGPLFLTRFCLLPDNLVRLGNVDSKMAHKIVKAKKFLKSLDYLWMAYYAMYDLNLHRSTKHWELVHKSVWDDFMPFGRPKDDFRILNRADLMATDKHGTGYSQLWTEVAVVNAIDTFLESGSHAFVKKTVITPLTDWPMDVDSFLRGLDS